MNLSGRRLDLEQFVIGAALDGVEPGNRVGAHVNLIEGADIGAVFARMFEVDFSLFVHFVEVLFEEERVRDALLHADADEVGVAGDDSVADWLDIVEEDFECGDAAAADARGEALANDAADAVAQLQADEVAFDGVEETDDAVDHLASRIRVQGADDQVAGGGGVDGGADGVGVAHFSDDDDVGVVPQGSGDRHVEGADVGAEAALRHDGFFVGMDVFDGVFDGEDVHGFMGVDPVDEGGHGGGFSAAGHTGHEEQSVMEIGQFDHGVAWNAQFFEGGDAFGEEAQGTVGCAGLDEGGYAGVTEADLVVVETCLFGVFEFFPVFILCDIADQGSDLHGREGSEEFGVVHVAVDAEDGAYAGRQVHVAGFVLDHGLEEEFWAYPVDAVVVALCAPDFGQIHALAQFVERFEDPGAGGLIFGRAGEHDDAIFPIQGAGVGVFGGEGDHALRTFFGNAELEGPRIEFALEVGAIGGDFDVVGACRNAAGDAFGSQQMLFNEANDCPHALLLPRSENELRHGKNSPLFRRQVFWTPDGSLYPLLHFSSAVDIIHIADEFVKMLKTRMGHGE